MTADGLPGSARGVPHVCPRDVSGDPASRVPMTGCKKALLILERMTVKSRQTTLATELEVGLCNVCFQGKPHKFSEANSSRHLKYLLGNSQPGPAADSFRHDAGSGPETCFVCSSHNLFVLGGSGEAFPPFICSMGAYLYGTAQGPGERRSHCSQEAHKEVPKF